MPSRPSRSLRASTASPASRPGQHASPWLPLGSRPSTAPRRRRRQPDLKGADLCRGHPDPKRRVRSASAPCWRTIAWSQWRTYVGTFWPSPLQAALLRVALDDRPEAAVRSWQELRPSLDVEMLEPGLVRADAACVSQPDGRRRRRPRAGPIEGHRSRTWVKNNLLGERTKAAAEALAAGDVPALFIEGVALASRFDPELGLRPTSFIDVLVNGHDCQAARTRLADLGWKTAQGTEPGVPGGPRHLVDQHGNVCPSLHDRDRPHNGAAQGAFRSGLGHVAPACLVRSGRLRATANRDALRSGRLERPLEKPQEPSVDRGCKGNHRSRDRLEPPVRAREATGQVLRLREACIDLASLPGAKPPAELHERLSNVEVTRRERFFYFCNSRGRCRAWAICLASWRSTSEPAGTERISGRSRVSRDFFRDHWNLAHTWEVPIAAGRRALGRLGARRKQPGAGTGGVDS